MYDKHLVRILKEITLLLETKGENPFKAKAYTTAARKIETDNIDVTEHVRNGTLDDVPGFGKAMVEKITDYVNNGTMNYYENLKKEVPAGLIELNEVRGLGGKKAKELYEEHGIRSVAELQAAAETGALAGIKGFGDKVIEQIKKSLGVRKASAGRSRLDKAYEEAALLLQRIEASGLAEKAIVSGELARWCETVSEVLIVIATGKRSEFITHLDSFYTVEKEERECTLKSEAGVLFRCIFAESGNAHWTAHAHSGSEDFTSAFFELLKYKGYEAGPVSLKKDGKEIQFKSEKEIYNEAGLQYIIPELREEAQALQFAAQGHIPEMVAETDMRGMIHNHSTWSDGRNSLEEMALAAKELGFSYFVICDHSRTAAYANGLSMERVLEQHGEIEEINSRNIGIRIFKGIESDILPTGDLDYPDEILALFDVVVASVHSSFTLGREEQTERIVKALKNPFTTILGHPSGRLLLQRDGYETDMKKIIDTAAEYGKVIEINANPHRLDLDWRWVQYAKQKRVKLAVNPDAHRTKDLAHYKYGIHIARKGWAEKADIINTYDIEKFKKEMTWQGRSSLI